MIKLSNNPEIRKQQQRITKLSKLYKQISSESLYSFIREIVELEKEINNNRTFKK